MALCLLFEHQIVRQAMLSNVLKAEHSRRCAGFKAGGRDFNKCIFGNPVRTLISADAEYDVL